MPSTINATAVTIASAFRRAFAPISRSASLLTRSSDCAGISFTGTI
jgi:hypothetical protein